MSSQEDRRAFRADTLDEALRLVSDELGPDAIVIRQREGIVGGIGGFFGKRCVELEAEPAPPAEPDEEDSWFSSWDDTAADWPTQVTASLPPRTVIDAYDTGETAWPSPTVRVLPKPQPAPEPEPEPVPAAEDPGPLVQTIFDQAAPFAEELSTAMARVEPLPVLEPEPAPGSDPGLTPEVLPAPLVQPEPAAAAEPEPVVGSDPGLTPAPAPGTEDMPAQDVVRFDPGAIERMLVRGGISEKIAREVVAEAETELHIFDPLTPFEEHVRRTLARRIRIARSTRKKRRVVALVGPPGSGKTLAAARLLHAHRACANRAVAGLTLASVRDALALADQTRSLAVPITAATEASGLQAELDSLDPVDLLVVDTPGVEPEDADRLAALGYLLELVGADETHLLVPASYGPDRVRRLVDAFAPALGADRLMITHLDGRGTGAAAVSAAVTARLPVSFTAVGTSWGLRPATAEELAGMVIP